MKKMITLDSEKLRKSGRAGTLVRGISPRADALMQTSFLGQGLAIEANHFQLKDDARVYPSSAYPPMLMFYACLSGRMKIAYPGTERTIVKDTSGIEFIGDGNPVATELCSSSPVQTFCVYVDPLKLIELTGKSREYFMEMWDRVNHLEKQGRLPNRARELDADIAANAYQALSATRTGSENMLFIQAKALELIARQTTRLELLSGMLTLREPDVQRDSNQIFLAAQILKDEMEFPPDGVALGRRVGLCYTRLLAGFKEQFGMTPVVYLKSARLRTAYQRMASGSMNVTEASVSVGYSSLSHFTKAFTREFGFPPRECVAGRRSR